MLDASGVGSVVQSGLRPKGSGAPKSANLMVSTSVAGGGGRLSARHLRRLFVAHRAPLSVAGYGRSVSQLLAGTRIGPGGSPDAARVPDCGPARGRRAPSRFMTPHERALQRTRWVDDTGGLGSGDKDLRHTGASRYPVPARDARNRRGLRVMVMSLLGARVFDALSLRCLSAKRARWIPACAGMTRMGIATSSGGGGKSTPNPAIRLAPDRLPPLKGRD
jgi:hypothetical protein